MNCLIKQIYNCFVILFLGAFGFLYRKKVGIHHKDGERISYNIMKYICIWTIIKMFSFIIIIIIITIIIVIIIIIIITIIIYYYYYYHHSLSLSLSLSLYIYIYIYIYIFFFFFFFKVHGIWIGYRWSGILHNH